MSFTPEEAMKLTLDACAPLGTAYVDTLRRGFASRWVDWMPSTGKSSGAYSTGAYGVHPYQLQNYTGLYDEVGTLAHESGHSLHTWLSNRAQPFVSADYPIFVAEVASTVNEALLHTDSSLLPRAGRAHAAWNFLRREAGASGLTVTYDLSRLQGLSTPEPLLLTLGGSDRVDPTRIVERMEYEHPIYTPASVAAQKRFPAINTPRVAFAGAYHGWGFHEDGAQSGLAAAEHAVALHLQDHFAVLVAHLPLRTHDARVRPAAHRPRFEDGVAQAQPVAGIHRLEPAQPFEAG